MKKNGLTFRIPFDFLHSLCKCMGPHWKYAVIVGYAKKYFEKGVLSKFSFINANEKHNVNSSAEELYSCSNSHRCVHVWWCMWMQIGLDPEPRARLTWSGKFHIYIAMLQFAIRIHERREKTCFRERDAPLDIETGGAVWSFLILLNNSGFNFVTF